MVGRLQIGMVAAIHSACLAAMRRNPQQSAWLAIAWSAESGQHLVEKSRREKAVFVTIAVRYFPQVVAGPEKFVAFSDDDP
jgi:hypothetical protein